MHIYTLQKWQHTHQFTLHDSQNERKTLWVVLLTVSMMVIEVTAGLIFGSMALVADGWHMSTHATALGISLFVYAYARKHRSDRSYTFGTGKMNVLGGFTSAIILLVVAFLMAFESLKRYFSPQEIRFDEAIFVAVIGLLVNLGSAFILNAGHSHHHHPEGEHEHHHPEASQDLNLRAAYLHVLADALTSFLAIFALLAGKMLGWIWMDATMGIVGSLVITKWSLGLLKVTSKILLDNESDGMLVDKVRAAVEADADNRVCDLHVWKIGSDQYAAILSIVTHFPQPVEHYKGLLKRFDHLAHVTVEVNVCSDEPCILLEPAQ